MLVIKGVYENGQVRLLEPVPADIEEPQSVMVTFFGPEEGDSQTILKQAQAELGEASSAALALIGLLDDLTPEQLEAFDSAVERRHSFFGPREVTW